MFSAVLEKILSVGLQLNFNLSRQNIRVAERDGALLRFNIDGEKTGICFLYDPVSLFNFSASIRSSVENTGTFVQTH